MYYSADAFYEYVKRMPRHQQQLILNRGGETKLSKRAIARVHKRAMKAVSNRNVYCNETRMYVGKWHRPWHVVPQLRQWRAPAGDYGIGIEVEMGFRTREDAAFIANAVKHWRNITLDFEGGRIPIEATFPPTRYSRFGKNSQASRYLQILEENRSRVVNHNRDGNVGIHINVSKGGSSPIPVARTRELSRCLSYLPTSSQIKYFGRIPYGFAYDHVDYIEYKLFNSTTDWKVLRRYVDIAVELSKLIFDTSRRINEESVIAACEAGYNKR